MRFKEILSILLLSACTENSGNFKVTRDEFLGREIRELTLGAIEAKPTKVEAKIMQAEPDQFYLIITSTSQFDASGMKCPKVNKASKVQFKDTNNKFYEFKVAKDPIITEKLTTLISVGCQEIIEIGPINKEFLHFMASQQEMQFRIYGERFNLDGKFNSAHLALIRQFE